MKRALKRAQSDVTSSSVIDKDLSNKCPKLDLPPEPPLRAATSDHISREGAGK